MWKNCIPGPFATASNATSIFERQWLGRVSTGSFAAFCHLLGALARRQMELGQLGWSGRPPMAAAIGGHYFIGLPLLLWITELLLLRVSGVVCPL